MGFFVVVFSREVLHCGLSGTSSGQVCHGRFNVLLSGTQLLHGFIGDSFLFLIFCVMCRVLGAFYSLILHLF